ncbi:hypothetical protein MRB53_028049 [Persea americana]|uniref:Uncharacterized protein n=1 Tax=Persea americana TaxID=3435 RepID=A0ACC2KEG0_PERAE|nr:hypothetical protein MRB53_028049 [Persea americana]
MEDIVLCKIYRKATSLKVLERAAKEDDAKMLQFCGYAAETASSPEEENWQVPMPLKEEFFMEKWMENEKERGVSSRLQGDAKVSLPPSFNCPSIITWNGCRILSCSAAHGLRTGLPMPMC